MIISLINGAALLLALCWMHAFITRRWDKRSTAIQMVLGLLFGAICLISMLNPISPEPGMYFDGRSVVLSMAALFNGPLVACIAGLIAGIYRIWVGGSGMAFGLVEIGLSILFGLLYRHYSLKGKWTGPYQTGHLHPVKLMPLPNA